MEWKEGRNVEAEIDANAARIARVENENKTMQTDILNLSNLITELIDKFNSIIVNNKENAIHVKD
jgi:Mg2+ and Co2+ transporter CorA